MSTDVYSGNFFSIEQAGDDWSIWRHANDDGEREQIILTREGMDELHSYFTTYFAEDTIAAGREP